MAALWREVSANWMNQGKAFKGENPENASVQMGPLDERPGFSPMELMLMSVAGCSGMTVLQILQKKQQHIKDFKVSVKGLFGESEPHTFEEIHVHFSLYGDKLSETAVERAIQLSEETYCNAVAMLKKVAKIHSTYSINDETKK